MDNLWLNDASGFVGDFAQRVTSRLLGRNKTLVLHGTGLCGPLFAKTTADKIPMDGSNDWVI